MDSSFFLDADRHLLGIQRMSLAALQQLPKTGRGGTFTCPPPYQEHAEAVLHCGVGYALPATTTSRVVLQEGQLVWKPSELHCLPVSLLMSLPDTAEGGTVTSPQDPPYHLHDEAVLTCDPGYRVPPQTATSRVVLEKGHLVWQPAQLACRPVQCGQPPIPHYGTTSHHEFHFPKSFRYLCFEGYRFNQPRNQFWCGVSGQWTPSTRGVDCVPVQCPALTAPAHGSLVTTGRFFRDVATFSCHAGYTLVQGQKKRVCQASGAWDGLEVSCAPVSCPPMPSSIRVVLSNDSYNTVDCGNENYINVKCTEVGKWIYKFPYCNRELEDLSVPPAKRPSPVPPPPPTVPHVQPTHPQPPVQPPSPTVPPVQPPSPTVPHVQPTHPPPRIQPPSPTVSPVLPTKQLPLPKVQPNGLYGQLWILFAVGFLSILLCFLLYM